MVRIEPSTKTRTLDLHNRMTMPVNKLILPCYKFRYIYSDDKDYLIHGTPVDHISFSGEILNQKNRKICHLWYMYYDFNDTCGYILSKGKQEQMLKVADLLEKSGIDTVIQI